MNEREFLRAVRKLAEDNNLDFLAATQNCVDWSFYNSQSKKLCELADVCKSMKTLNLSSPWQIHRQKLAALFELDAEVTVGPVETTESGASITVSVANHQKAAALRKLLALPEFGDAPLSITVVDTAEEETPADLLRAAFAYNRIVRDIETATDPTGTVWTYLVMEPLPVQFPADNLSDYRGNLSMLAMVAARDVLNLDAGRLSARLTCAKINPEIPP